MENKITEINGVQLYNSFISGAQKIFENQALLNKINVFPVADADTGSNLASTMLSIVNTAQPQENLKNTAVALADAALIGARGNSGIIFAQFLYGFSHEIKDEATLTVKSFAEYMQKAVRYAYEAIADPQEGTMISVIKDWANRIYQLKDSFSDFINMLLDGLKTALESLQSTARWIATKAKTIVDAGAKGFVVFLEGMFDYFKSGEATVTLTDNEVIDASGFDAIDHQTITFRYCTEALLSGEDMTRDKISHLINIMGDSLVIAGSPTKMRVHIHTDQPWEVMEKIQTVGKVVYQKVEDMVMQNDIVSNRKNKIGILTDSTCDIPQEMLEKHQIQTVPLSIHFGDEYYLDHLTIKPEQYLKKLYASKELPTSAQPSLADFTNKYNYLSTHYDSIISTHLSEVLSGTCNGSKKAAEKVSENTGKKISVVYNHGVTCGLGLTVLRMAECIENGMEHDELVHNMEEWRLRSKMWVSCKNTKYMIKCGRLSSFKSMIIKNIGIKPVVSFNEEGKLKLINASLTCKNSYKKVLNDVKEYIGDGKVWNYAITHIDNLETALYYQQIIKEFTGKDALYISDGAPMLAGKVGPKTVAVAVMME